MFSYFLTFLSLLLGCIACAIRVVSILVKKRHLEVIIVSRLTNLLLLFHNSLIDALVVLFISLVTVVVVEVKDGLTDIQKEVKWDVLSVDNFLAINKQIGNKATNSDKAIDDPDPPTRHVENSLHILVMHLLSDRFQVL